jgi:DNA-directed RNA polymerase subunit RPC12/RpoP
MASVERSHIQLSLKCSECGYQWEVENHLDFDISEALMTAEDEPCPECEDV